MKQFVVAMLLRAGGSTCSVRSAARQANQLDAEKTRCDRAARATGDQPKRSCQAPSSLVGRGDETLYHKAIGNRALVPSVEAMTLGHHLRSRVAHQGRGDDDQRDDPRGGREDPAERSRGDLHPRLRDGTAKRTSRFAI